MIEGWRLIGLTFDKAQLRRLSTQTIWIGVAMVLVGAIGIFVPSFLSLVVVNFIAWLFMFSAVVQGYHTYRSYRNSLGSWLKALMALIAAIILLFFPMAGVAAIGMLLAVYLMIDAIGSLSFAWEYRPNRGWWMMLLNGILSIVLAIILLVGWPFSSVVLVGLFVGFSLFFDGVALIALGAGAKRVGDEEIQEQQRNQEDINPKEM